MEKRVLLAVFLSFLVLFVYQSLIGPPPSESPAEAGAVAEAPAAEPATPPPSAAVAASPEAAPPPPSSSTTPTDAAPAELTTATPISPIVADPTEREIVVETDQVIATFSTRGGVLTSWRLKGYAETSGEFKELVPSGAEMQTPPPFTLEADEAPLTAQLANALFRPSASSLDVRAEPRSLVFEYEDTSGLSTRKEYHFDPENQPFVVRFSASVETAAGPANPAVRWGPGLGGSAAPSSGFAYRQGPQAIFFMDGDVSRLDAADLEETPGYDGTFEFVGIDDHYFLSAALPDLSPVGVTYQPVVIGTGDTQITLVDYVLRFPTPSGETRFYMGPKDFDILGAIDDELVRAVHFGFFSWLVVPLHRSLTWVHSYVGNWGWSIIILTIMINAAMFPLRHKSVVSMRKMQELQPETKSIQERYKGLKVTDPDKQKMNQELMGLYRDRGVNPASGCLPMLLTMPVLFAFYSLLSVAIEIRDAPFILWIQDLSQHDPMYVTPLLMGVTMVAQQRMTPSTADPTQQKVMMMMPIVFTFMFLWAPSGLVLYWFCSNLWGVGQQVMTNRIIGPPKVHSVRPPAERQVKKQKKKKKGGDR